MLRALADPDMEGEGRFAFIVPARTPRHITDLPYRETTQCIELTKMKEQMAKVAFEPVATPPENAATSLAIGGCMQAPGATFCAQRSTGASRWGEPDKSAV
jgi:hypothetical protein